MEDKETTPLLGSNSSANYSEGAQARPPHSVASVQQEDHLQTESSTEIAGKAADSDEASFSLGGLSARQKITLVVLAASNLFSGCGFSLLAPFFPQEAAKKGASDTVVGLIFSIFQLVIFLFSPIFGNYITTIGPKFMFVSGNFVGGACAILFGLLDRCPSGNTFIIMCFLCRSVEALGITGLITASFAIISNEFPKHVATVFGVLETASGVGLMVGPAIGGVLYQVGGFGPPFYTMGGLILLNGLLILKFLPEYEDTQDQRKKGAWTLLTSVYVWVSMLVILTTSTGISFTDPTLSPHLEKFHLSTALIGLVFTIAPAIYSFTAPLYGYLSDTKGYTTSLLLLGNSIYGISFLLLGPSPYLTFLPRELWVVIIGMILLGLSIGCAVIPVVKCMLLAACEIGFENNMDTYGLVSGLFNSVWCLGGFLGPTIGGALVNEIGFPDASSAMCLLAFFTVLIVLLYAMLRKMRPAPDPASLEISYSYTHLDGASPSLTPDMLQVSLSGSHDNGDSRNHGNSDNKETV